MKTNKIILLSVLLFILIVFTSCAPGTGKVSPENPAGFLWGIWHGWIAPVSIIWEIFNPSIRVYETTNTGLWYDFGFYISIIAGFGSISFIRKRNTRKHQ